VTEPLRSSPINPSTPLGVPTTWPVIRLRARSKKAVERGAFTPIKSHALAKRYLDQGANLGLLTGQVSGIIVLDGDDRALLDDMMAALGRLTIFAYSGRGEGRVHIYAQWYPGLRTKVIWWKGQKVGHLLSDRAYAVMPPSVHPDTGQRYAWDRGVDPLLTPLPTLPAAWQAYIATQPDAASLGDRPAPQAQAAVPAEEYARRKALALEEFDGTERQASGNVKFRCPGCGDEDAHGDNAVLFPNGSVWCWTRHPDHNAELRRRFGIPTGARSDADPWVQAQVTQWLVDMMQPKVVATVSSSLLAMLHAHASIVYRLGRLDYAASEREVAELAGIGHLTVRANNAKLIRSGFFTLTTRGRRGPGRPTRWRFNLPASYRLQDPDQVALTTQSVPSKGVKQEELLEKIGSLMLPAVDWPLILAHDVFRNRVGLGKGCGRVYLHLLLAGPVGISIMLFGATKKMTVSRQLATLRSHNLARLDRQTHR